MFIKSFKSQIAFALLCVILAGSSMLALGRRPQEEPLLFKDQRSQTKEYIGYYHSIALNPEQKQLKERALKSIPAPCCKDYPVLACCCPCNFAKSVWGLANYLIVKRNYSEARLKMAVTEWINFTHSSGYSGDSCYQGRCGLPTTADGCGGMDEQQPVF